MLVKSETPNWGYPEIDHFILEIGNKEQGVKIYDPLTNPLLIFNLDEYTAEVKCLFRAVQHPKNALYLNIDAQFIRLFDVQTGKAARFLSQERQKTTAELLNIDSNYQTFLIQHGIEDKSQLKTKAAYVKVCELLGWEVPKTELDHPLFMGLS